MLTHTKIFFRATLVSLFKQLFVAVCSIHGNVGLSMITAKDEKYLCKGTAAISWNMPAGEAKQGFLSQVL